MDAQKYLFEAIKSQLPEHYRFADAIGDTLGVSADSAYRRIRGERELSLSEFQKLCSAFNISPNSILNDDTAEQGAQFMYTSVNMADQPSYVRHIKRLSDTLSALIQTDDKEMMFTAQDIPFYHFLNYTELLSFKLYAWNDASIAKKITFKDFCAQLDTDAILPVYDSMINSYMQIPSKEIWTKQTIDTVLRMIDYYTETGAFDSKETVLRLLNQVDNLIDTVNTYAQDGHKGGKRQTPFTLYVCSVDLENNFMLTRANDRRTCSIKLYTVNSIATTNNLLCAETEKYINYLINKSIMISGETSTRERFRFFQSSKNKIEELVGNVKKAKYL